MRKEEAARKREDEMKQAARGASSNYNVAEVIKQQN